MAYIRQETLEISSYKRQINAQYHEFVEDSKTPMIEFGEDQTQLTTEPTEESSPETETSERKLYNCCVGTKQTQSSAYKI